MKAYRDHDEWERTSEAGIELDDFCQEHAEELIAELRQVGMNAAPQDKTLSGVCPEPAVAAPDTPNATPSVP